MLTIEGLRDLHKLMAKLRDAAAVYPGMQKQGSQAIYIDWPVKGKHGAGPTMQRIEITVTDE